MTVYLVTDGPSGGMNPDQYGIFSTRALAQAWIDRQRKRGYPFWDCLTIEEQDLDDARDLQP